MLFRSGSAFTRALSFALGNQFNDVLTIYIDDLLIATPGSFTDHLNSLRKIFTILQNQNFSLKLEKSHFCCKSVKFLGYELSTEGILLFCDKLDVTRSFPIPGNRNQLQQFLGVCTYYRQFSVRHSNFVDFFRTLLKESGPWNWTSEHTRVFNDLKENFANCIMLRHIIPNATFRLQTDASNFGISGILYQFDKFRNHRVVTLVSRCLNQAELNYTTTEKELLAIIYSITKLRTLLIGKKF